MTGDNSINRLNGNSGDDALFGMGGNDILIGGLGSDALDGGDGNRDAADYENAASSVGVDLINGGFAGEADGDTYANIEFVYGSNHDDWIGGDDGVNRLVGRDGDDYLFGAGGNDYIIGGAGNDQIAGGEGNDVFSYDDLDFGLDVILDFEFGPGRTDRIWFDNLGVNSFAELNARENEHGVALIFSDTAQVLLNGVTLAELSEDDFIF